MGYGKTKGDIETETHDQDNEELARMASKIPNKGPFKGFGKNYKVINWSEGVSLFSW